jgi:hypothetical protein
MLMIFVVLVAFVSYDMQIQRSQKLVTEFTEQIQYNGRIRDTEYRNVAQNLPIPGTQLLITAIHTDDNGISSIKLMNAITSANRSSDGSGVEYYDDDNTLSNDGYVEFERGDLIKVELYDTNRTVLDTFTNALFGKGSSAVKLIATDAGVVVNVKDY